MDKAAELRQLEARLADLKSRMPAHSVRPAMLLEMEDLEEAIGRLRAELRAGGKGDAQGSA
ncbi:MAG: histidine kinase [Chloroflexota bacterium]